MLSSSRQEQAQPGVIITSLDTRKKPGFFSHLTSSEAFQGYLFISPWLIGFLTFGLWPLLDTFYNSFTKYNLFGSPQWIGLKNYVNIFTRDPVFTRASLNMLVYVIAATIVSICGGLLLALLLNQQFPGNHIFRTIVYVPSLLVGVAIGMLFKQIFASGQNGLANEFLGLFHIAPISWLQDYNHPIVALIALILVNLWFIGATMLIFLAGLKGIPASFYEAAKVDGAGRWSIFWGITLPLLSPVIVFNTILTLIGHMQVFETPLVFAVSQGSVASGTSNPLGYHNDLATFLTYIYERAFILNDFGYASALAIIVFVITLLLSLIVLGGSRFTYGGDLG
jgi:ABC-type sugar transport system permease subunit